MLYQLSYLSDKELRRIESVGVSTIGTAHSTLPGRSAQDSDRIAEIQEILSSNFAPLAYQCDLPPPQLIVIWSVVGNRSGNRSSHRDAEGSIYIGGAQRENTARSRQSHPRWRETRDEANYQNVIDSDRRRSH
ncbi:MAG TPA: hypothetical protein VL475_00045 [Planctomycetaceae bacterium]|nr:hypothetical protein [Planctomycetaceae bacterium]